MVVLLDCSYPESCGLPYRLCSVRPLPYSTVVISAGPDMKTTRNDRLSHSTVQVVLLHVKFVSALDFMHISI